MKTLTKNYDCETVRNIYCSTGSDCPQLLVLCDEIIGQIRRMMEGNRIDKEHLSLDCVKRVGPEGHFLGD